MRTLVLCLLLLVVLVVMANMKKHSVREEPQVPCYYIFGDSLVDAGNINHLATLSKIDYPPYGINSRNGPTGKYSNDRTVGDIIGKLLAFDNFIPPFESASGSQILKGVNYASGSAGIRKETSKFLGVNIDLDQQIQNHGTTVSRIADILENNKSANEHLNKCLYILVAGSNDYINNYFSPQFYDTSKLYTPEQYTQVLIEDYSQYIMKLYNYGARKVALTGIGPIGCTPKATSSYHTKGSLCVDYMNEAANYFNHNLKSLVNVLSSKLSDAKFIYLNVYGLVEDPPTPEPQVPCFNIFGDSLQDAGNNNILQTNAKANYTPYGIDFPNGPNATGRFTNDLTTVDYLSQILGFTSFIPSFVSAGNNILNGINYASGASGIRDETGKHLGDNFSFNRQLLNHQIIIARLIQSLGTREAALNYLNKCLYYVAPGNNDYLNNYFMPQYYPSSSIYTPTEFAQELIDQYSFQIRILYRLGARKVVLVGLGRIGCTLYSISLFGTNGSTCVDKINNAVQIFNAKLKSLVDQLNNELTDAKFILINSYGMSGGHLTQLGFTVLNASCCQPRSDGQCAENGQTCTNRDIYEFFDMMHPTSARNRFTASRSYRSLSSSDAYPYDISQLVNM